jgi:hypothetical protein
MSCLPINLLHNAEPDLIESIFGRLVVNCLEFSWIGTTSVRLKLYFFLYILLPWNKWLYAHKIIGMCFVDFNQFSMVCVL